MPYSLVYLLLCLSLHSTAISTASRLGVFDKENNKGTSHLLGKAVEQEKLHKILMPSMAIQDKVLVGRSSDETRIHDCWDIGATTIKRKDLEEVPCKEKEDNKVVLGLAVNEVLEPISQEDHQKATRIKEWKVQLARRMMGSTSSKAEETIDSKEDDSPEDIVVMDNAQPHRKPPIHNLEP
ncbi:hypothetical protein Vadar_011333 [Vaccinium darrowii]|uniref:Uncharacterized protein n=1 Tax=Vaccinium darrowii TaxID=229202 RepID=A0ACB7WZW4_9ERIC|nr:hypothetical protein Vadar_011333 [Vaccinium darrowii]